MSKKDITQNMLNCLAEYANNVRRDLTSACANALKAGAYLNHIRTTNNIPMTDALSRIGLSRATAYRWMDAHNTACKILELQATPSVLDADFAGHLAALDDIAKGMSLSRLALGAPAPSSDIARLDILQTGAETAETEQEEVSIHALVRVRRPGRLWLEYQQRNGCFAPTSHGGTHIPGRKKEMIVVKIRTPTDYVNRRCPGNFL